MGVAMFEVKPSDRFRPIDPTSELLARIRAGDRDAAAEFMKRFGPILRQRFRARMSHGLRRLMDTGDLLSTVTRRLDQAVAEHRASFVEAGALVAFVYAVANNVIADKARVIGRLRTAEAEDGPIATSMLNRVERLNSENGVDDMIEFVFSSLTREDDRRMLALWLSGMNLATIALELGIQHDAARARWGQLRHRMSTILEAADGR